MNKLHRSLRGPLVPAAFLAAALAALVAIAAPAAAQLDKASLYAGSPALAKISSHLMRARALAAADRSAEEIAAAVPLLQLRDELPEVAIRLSRLTPAILEELRGRGLLVDSYHEGYARAYGRVDPADLDKLAALAEVITIQPMPRRGTRTGSVTSQADATMNSDDVRSTFSYDGTGVKVGILSDSFNSFGGGTVSGIGCSTMVTGTTSQTSGDVPNDSGDVLLLNDGPMGTLSDEGRAIAELITDVAPGATFAFHSAFNSPADFADGITELDNCSANLIVDDAFWTGQAFFQDDIIAQAAQGAVDNGTPYFSAAGNDATFGIHDDFLDVDPGNSTVGDFPPNGDDFHDFDPGASTDAFAAITVPDECQIVAELQWANPFESIGDPLPGPGAIDDLDLYFLSSAADPASTGGTNILGQSATPQGCGSGGTNGDPIEQVEYINMTGGLATVFLAIDHWCGSTDPLDLRIVMLSFNCGTTGSKWDFEDGFDAGVADPSETPIFVDPQIFGHPAAKDVIAVGATFYGEVDSGGTLDPPPSQLDVEPFSSLGGPIPFYFDTAGSPLPSAPQTRFKPEVTGPDGTNTTFFGGDITFDVDTHPNFFGTSAAAPNSAAIAALILEATDLKINPLPLKQLLSQAAIDMEGTGLDPLSGFGFTDALRPIRSLDPSVTPLIDDLEFDLDGGAFFSSPPTGGTQRVQAKNSITYGDGDFSGLDAFAETHIFADGFESGDTSAWTSSTP